MVAAAPSPPPTAHSHCFQRVGAPPCGVQIIPFRYGCAMWRKPHGIYLPRAYFQHILQYFVRGSVRSGRSQQASRRPRWRATATTEFALLGPAPAGMAQATETVRTQRTAALESRLVCLRVTADCGDVRRAGRLVCATLTQRRPSVPDPPPRLVRFRLAARPSGDELVLSATISAEHGDESEDVSLGDGPPDGPMTQVMAELLTLLGGPGDSGGDGGDGASVHSQSCARSVTGVSK